MKNLVKKIANFLNLKELGKKALMVIILTLTAIITVWVYAAFVEPSAGPNDSDQDFAQNILGANNADNDFDSSLVTVNKDGSIIERLQYISKFYIDECGESTIATQTECYVDDTVRYLTTDLCNETKENQCFVPTDNSYYAFGSECSDSTDTAATNCYVDDTAKYVGSGACSAASNSGYCFMNTATFSAMDSDLTAANIKNGVNIFGVTGTLASAQSNPDYPDSFHIAAFIEPSAAPADFDQDFTQNILGANNVDNDFDSFLVASSSTGSIIERLEFVAYNLENNARWFPTECGESTTSAQTNCYVDDTVRYLTTDLCNEAKENVCFIPTDNGYYAFGTECSDSTTSTQTNCYVDDTSRYVDSNVCSAASNNGYCYMNTDTFTAMDADLVAANIMGSKTIFGIAGTALRSNGTTCTADGECISGNCYRDIDGDRYAPSSGAKVCQVNAIIAGTDCCDTDANAKPGQTTYFSSANACASYDYDCNGTGDKYPVTNCVATTIWDNCRVGSQDYAVGFGSSVPACGASGTWYYCRVFDQSGCVGTSADSNDCSVTRNCLNFIPDWGSGQSWLQYHYGRTQQCR